MQPADTTPSCPECETGQPRIGRRDFIRVLGTAAAAVRRRRPDAAPARPAPPAPRSRREAEALVFELFKSMDARPEEEAGAAVGPQESATSRSRPA